jgi:hypothetical protein
MSVWSSNTNAVLNNQCQALSDVTVNLEVTEDLVTDGDGGFTMQLNAYPMAGVTCVGLPMDWIQYCLYVNNAYGPNTAAFQWQAWSLESTAWSSEGEPQNMSAGPTQPVPWHDKPYKQPNAVFGNVPNNRLPKGSNLTIALSTDKNTHAVTSATFTVQLPGAQPMSVTVDFPAVVPFTFTTGASGSATAQFPLGGFQVNLVGPDNLAYASFIAGAGELSYSVPEGSSLFVQSGPVGTACGQYSGSVTGEMGNMLYGPVASARFPLVGQPPTLFQTFGLFRGAKTFSAVSADAVYVIDSDGTLWLEQAPFGPGNRTQVDANAIACSAVDVNTVYVVGSDGKLWLEHAPFGQGNIPPKREPVDPADGNAVRCSAVNRATVYVLDSDGNLWLENAPFPTIPADRTEIAAAVDCSAVDANTVYLVDDAGNAWLKQTFPTGSPPPTQIDARAVGCSAVDAKTVYILGSDGTLWLTPAPFGQVANPNRTEVDNNVVGCSAVDANTVYVLDRDGSLWLEHGPFDHGTPVDANVMVQPGSSHGLVLAI